MNDTSPSPATRSSVAQSGALGAWWAPGRRVQLVLGASVVLLVVAMAALWWRSTTDLSFTQREFARRIADADARSVAANQTAQDAANRVVDVLKQIAVLEAKIAESQSQQAALEQMYQDLSRNRDEIQLADIEQTIAAAAQQLQLTGNVQAALLALQNADTRLARFNKPQFVGVRRALARDIDRLKALPGTDITGMAVKLDQAIALVDAMPSLVDEKPAPTAGARQPKPPAEPARTPPRGGATKAPATAPVPSAVTVWWTDLTARLDTALRSLVRIREVDAPDALLLAPSQVYFVRENLKLRLLNARLQLLARNEAGFRSDLQAGLDWIGRYFDTRAKQTQVAQALLRQLQTAQVAVELPSLADSLGVVRNFKPGPGAAAAPAGAH